MRVLQELDAALDACARQRGGRGKSDVVVYFLRLVNILQTSTVTPYPQISDVRNVVTLGNLG